MENTKDPASPSAVTAYEVMKATILHELGHTAVSRALGTLSSELYDFPVKPPKTFSPNDILELNAIVERRVGEVATPEKFGLPWKKDKGEAGDWVEFTLFGGIVQLDSKRRVTLQTGLHTKHILPSDHLQRAQFAIVLNYVNEYTDLHPSTISTLKKKADGNKPRPISGQLELPTQKCPGALFKLSLEANVKLRRLLAGQDRGVEQIVL
ncbi:hypothetical protein DFH07DRAFT_850024 [Mycena maculata]|uniref:Uncharacterized protein n=1 Tax=Mycena maculata TaxID=230809 RepID=A0AAD7HVU3_9AGAR|nr:hypothetical protein DFH07DRAFT_850024 [Mycena maculata]